MACATLPPDIFTIYIVERLYQFSGKVEFNQQQLLNRPQPASAHERLIEREEDQGIQSD